MIPKKKKTKKQNSVKTLLNLKHFVAASAGRDVGGSVQTVSARGLNKDREEEKLTTQE